MEEIKEAPKVEETKPQAQAQTTTQAAPAPESEETPQHIDWKRFKEARKKEREQKEEAEKRAAQSSKEAEALKAALESLVNKPSYPQNQQAEESEEDRTQKLIQKALSDERARWEEEQRKRDHAQYPQRILAAHPDFDSVITNENIDYLEYHYPEVASAFKSLPDGYDKWSNIYKAVKKFVPNTSSGKEQKKAEKNFNKPQAMAVPGVTQTGDGAPMMLDEKRKQDNWARMTRRMKGIQS